MTTRATTRLRLWATAVTVVAALAPVPEAWAQASPSGARPIVLLFPLRGDIEDVTLESSCLHMALNHLSGGAYYYALQQATIYRAIVEGRLTKSKAESWYITELVADKADPLGLELARAMPRVAVAVYGRVRRNDAGSLVYDLRVIDVEGGQCESISVTEGDSPISEDAARAVLATFAKLQQNAAAGRNTSAAVPGPTPTDGGALAPPGPTNATVELPPISNAAAAALYDKAVDMSLQRDLEGALSCLTQAERIEPDSPMIQLERAFVLDRMGDFQRALQACDAVLAHVPGCREAEDLRETLRARLAPGGSTVGPPEPDNPAGPGAPDVRALEEYVKANPKDRAAIEQLAGILERRGEYGRALSYYERLAEELVGDVVVQAKIGRMYERLGMNDKAEIAYIQILRWDPGNAQAHEDLGRLLGKPGPGAKADEAFDHFVSASTGWEPDHLIESPTYFILIDLVDGKLIHALDITAEGITMLQEHLRPRGEDTEFRREEIYSGVQASKTQADAAADMLAKLKPAPTLGPMNAKYLEAARLTALSCAKLMVALDESSEGDLQMAHSAREWAIDAMKAATELRGELPTPGP